MVLLIHIDGLHLHRLPIEIIVHTPRLIIYIAILHIGRDTQAFGGLPHSLHKEVSILLIHIVIVPAASNLLIIKAINPIQLTPMRAGVERIETTHQKRQSLGTISHRCAHTCSVVTHNLATHHISLDVIIGNAQIHILYKRALGLILIIISVTIGIKSHSREIPIIRNLMIYNQLIIDLQIVIRVVIVVIYVRTIGQNIRA